MTIRELVQLGLFSALRMVTTGHFLSRAPFGGLWWKERHATLYAPWDWYLLRPSDDPIPSGEMGSVMGLNDIMHEEWAEVIE